MWNIHKLAQLYFFKPHCFHQQIGSPKLFQKKHPKWLPPNIVHFRLWQTRWWKDALCKLKIDVVPIILEHLWTKKLSVFGRQRSSCSCGSRCLTAWMRRHRCFGKDSNMLSRWWFQQVSTISLFLPPLRDMIQFDYIGLKPPRFGHWLIKQLVITRISVYFSISKAFQNNRFKPSNSHTGKLNIHDVETKRRIWMS